MNSDKLKGAANQIAGKAKREFGFHADKPGTEAEGIAQQVKGKVQSGVGKLKDKLDN